VLPASIFQYPLILGNNDNFISIIIIIINIIFIVVVVVKNNIVSWNVIDKYEKDCCVILVKFQHFSGKFSLSLLFDRPLNFRVCTKILIKTKSGKKSDAQLSFPLSESDFIWEVRLGLKILKL
jgi:hypothetical protein